ncbi:hypothetical protein AN618_21350 [Fervidicola ferrireducens]|uniref:Uncharacterized protein n=1 Tax=Fervidicola ferrireducens TaxID=520764 RepID=A0A140L2Y5_9FIRM|nr:hypothetical protein [Fervidicola ferrireducens]KXG74910.1 hypothetical protein AN618_21350 [Fervidicola ferrireducens]
MMVKGVPLRNPKKIYNVARSLRRLVDRYTTDLRPSVFAKDGFHPGPRFVNAYLLIIDYPYPEDWVQAAREAARILEARHGVLLDWAAGYRKSGRIWLIIKALARDRETLKAKRFRPDVEDFEVLRLKLRKPKQGRERER